jgi:hypothetical protein
VARYRRIVTEGQRAAKRVTDALKELQACLSSGEEHKIHTKTQRPLLRKRNTPTEWTPLIGKDRAKLFRVEGCRMVNISGPHGR